ncbi:hypothetical protein, partial [Bradyrhizobium sp.]|uniref:hypothetical protein n=1 Tax=Bradyrhizobium sp. TaxID=376 RepID=UPI0025C50D7D
MAHGTRVALHRAVRDGVAIRSETVRSIMCNAMPAGVDITAREGSTRRMTMEAVRYAGPGTESMNAASAEAATRMKAAGPHPTTRVKAAAHGVKAAAARVEPTSAMEAAAPTMKTTTSAAETTRRGRARN